MCPLCCRMASRCFWDNETDHYAFETWKNVSSAGAASTSLSGRMHSLLLLAQALWHWLPGCAGALIGVVPH